MPGAPRGQSEKQLDKCRGNRKLKNLRLVKVSKKLPNTQESIDRRGPF